MKQFETQIRDFNQQFAEQIKCLDAKVAIDHSILGNILELYKRRSAIEQEYADSLSKLSSTFFQRRNADNQKRTNWKSYSPVNVLNSLLVSTQHIANAHKYLADIYGKQIIHRLMDMQEDCNRLNRKSTEILQKRHTEINANLNQLLLKQKHYVKLFNDADDARKRADKAMEQLDREVIRCQDKKKELDKNPRVKRYKDEYIEKDQIFKTKQGESTNARNDYIVNLLALKDTIDFFYNTELKAIVQCAEYGYHNNLTRFTMNHSSCEEALMTVHDSINKLFADAIEKIDAKNDTQVFLDAHKSILTLKENLHFNSAKGDHINKIIKSKKVQNCLQNMYIDCSTEVASSSKFVEEEKLCLNDLSETLNGLINQNDYDVVDYICHHSQSDYKTIRERSTSLPRNGVSENMYTSLQKLVREKRIKTEAKYFRSMENYLLHEAKKISAHTKMKHVDIVLKRDSDDSDDQCDKNCPSIQKSTAVIIGIQSKLFGGDLNKYCNDTKEMVPTVVQSCIRLINRYGMHNMGVFRVPGSQTEVQTFKSQFEQGKDPLRGLKGSLNDVNLAASILKLYFRELEPPMFNEKNFTSIVDNYNATKRDEDSIVNFLTDLISTFEPAAYTTLNYLVSFISHLAELCADNCMDILNLAIIFGPCLMPIPEDKSSQLFHYQSIVNHVTQCLITHHQTIFTKTTIGPIYERKPDSSQENDRRDSNGQDKSKLLHGPLTGSSEDVCKKSKSELKRTETVRYNRSVERENPLLIRRNSDSVKHCDILACAVLDYQAKNDQELSFKNGDSLLLKKKINENWWEGHIINNSDRNSPSLTRLIPSAFISIYNHNEMLPDSANSELLKHRDGDLSSPESQRLSSKFNHDHKRSMVSIDSDNEIDFSPDENRSLSRSLENTADLSECGETKSFESVENILNDDEFPKSETDIDVDKNSTFVQLIDTADDPPNVLVKIRESRSSTTIYPEFVDNDTDEDLELTIQGLKKIEEMNVIRHRNTVHIDKSLLTSKFISPLNSDHISIFDMKTPLSTIENSNRLEQLDVSEFKLKKPGNVSSLASSFEMNKTPIITAFGKPMELTTNSLNRTRHITKETPSLPPPILPRPKIFKK